MASANIRLSDIARDPRVAAFFRRGERDSGNTFALPVAPKPAPFDGAAVLILIERAIGGVA